MKSCQSFGINKYFNLRIDILMFSWSAHQRVSGWSLVQKYEAVHVLRQAGLQRRNFSQTVFKPPEIEQANQHGGEEGGATVETLQERHLQFSREAAGCA